MDIQKKAEIKAYSDFAISKFYQQYLKPYLKELEIGLLKEFEREPMSEFESLKRDLAVHFSQKQLRIIMAKIDKAPEKMSKIIQDNLKTNIN